MNEMLEWLTTHKWFRKAISLLILTTMFVLVLYRNDLKNEKGYRTVFVPNHISFSYFVITPNKTLIGWGSNENQLISENSCLIYPYLFRKVILSGVDEIYSNGNDCIIAIDENNVLYGWGRTESLLPGEKNSSGITRIMENVKSAALGSSHIAVVTESGELFAWGRNLSGQMGIGERGKQYYKKPYKIMDNIRSVFAFYDVSFAIDNNNNLYVWGNNYANADKLPLFTPTLICKGIKDVSFLSLNKYALLTQDGDILILDIAPAQVSGTYTDAVTSKEIIANNVETLLEGGFRKQDGSYWTWHISNDQVSAKKEPATFDFIQYYGDITFYLTNFGLLFGKGIFLVHFLQFVNPIIGNSLLTCALTLLTIKIICLTRKYKYKE